MAELKTMENIGSKMAKKLTAVGIDSPEELRRHGSKQAFIKLKEFSDFLKK